MTATPAKKIAKKIAKKATTTPAKAAPPAPDRPAPDRGPAVGALVEFSYDDVQLGTRVTETGIVTAITDDGAYIAPLQGGAVIPLDQVRAL